MLQSYAYQYPGVVGASSLFPQFLPPGIGASLPNYTHSQIIPGLSGIPPPVFDSLRYAILLEFHPV